MNDHLCATCQHRIGGFNSMFACVVYLTHPSCVQIDCREYEKIIVVDDRRVGDRRPDAPRRRTNSDSKGGDTVYWNPTSDLQCGKAYHKGSHLRVQVRRGNLLVDDETLQLADNLLRLELKLGSRWFRRYEDKYDWQSLTSYELTEIHHKFFNELIGGGDVEVHDMGTLLLELEKVCPTKGSAIAAHRTWALIKTVGYTQTKFSMPERTFSRASLMRAITSSVISSNIKSPKIESSHFK